MGSWTLSTCSHFGHGGDGLVTFTLKTLSSLLFESCVAFSYFWKLPPMASQLSTPKNLNQYYPLWLIDCPPIPISCCFISGTQACGPSAPYWFLESLCVLMASSFQHSMDLMERGGTIVQCWIRNEEMVSGWKIEPWGRGWRSCLIASPRSGAGAGRGEKEESL